MDNFVNCYGVDPSRDSQVFLPNGQGKAAWIDPADVGEVAAWMLTDHSHAGRTIGMTGPELLSTAEALALMGSVFGRQYTCTDLPELAARPAMEANGMPLWMVDAFLELNATVRSGDAARLADGVQEVLGRPLRTLRAWAQRVRRLQK